jgi:hypothetical protein
LFDDFVGTTSLSDFLRPFIIGVWPWCYRARLLMEIWTGWLMGISEDAQARVTLVDGALTGREQ